MNFSKMSSYKLIEIQNMEIKNKSSLLQKSLKRNSEHDSINSSNSSILQKIQDKFSHKKSKLQYFFSETLRESKIFQAQTSKTNDPSQEIIVRKIDSKTQYNRESSFQLSQFNQKERDNSLKKHKFSQYKKCQFLQQVLHPQKKNQDKQQISLENLKRFSITLQKKQNIQYQQISLSNKQFFLNQEYFKIGQNRGKTDQNFLSYRSLTSKDFFKQKSKNYYFNQILKGFQNNNQSVQKNFNSYIEVIQKQDQSQEFKLNPVYLPQSKHCKTLILDLDETLIHCVNKVDKSNKDADYINIICSGKNLEFYINYRPFLNQFLQKMSQSFEIIIFTASSQDYADHIIDKIDPQKKFISHRFYRDHCIKINNQYIKDLRLLANRDLKNIVIVDNNPYSFLFQIQNGIPILSYFNNQYDQELQSLSFFLQKQILDATDVRTAIKEFFKQETFQNIKSNKQQLLHIFQDKK